MEMKIALIGTRGVPAAHGGFETCVEEIGQRLVKKGHQVFVYSKKGPDNKSISTYKGMKIIKFTWINIKGFETLFASFRAAVHSIFFHYDIHLVFNGANSPVLLIYKLLQLKYVLNTDGLEWQRIKWGFIGRNYYKIAERISVLLCKNLVSDSQAIHDYYKEKYKVLTTIIAYGAHIPRELSDKTTKCILDELGVRKHKYILQITRFEPENYPLLTIKAFHLLQTDLKCVIIGGANYQSLYSRKIADEHKRNKNIVLPGFIYDKDKLETIWQNAYCYIHGNSVGGTNPALLQAMASGRPVIALDCIFNREVLSSYGYFYSPEEKSLLEQLNEVINNPVKAQRKTRGALERIKLKYDWDLVANQYEEMLTEIVDKRSN